MKKTFKNLTFGLASAALLILNGCGGGGGGTGSGSTSSTTGLPITVIDGPISNAKVCLDKNANGVCDPGEPNAITDGTGKAILQIDSADVGKFAVLSEVGLDAIDTDRPNTPITTAFTMTAPADQPAVISPLTTMVQTLVRNTGLTSNEAEAQLKSQTGLNVSLFEDFTKSTTADSVTAGTLARMLVVTTQQQTDALKTTINSTAIDGTTIKASDIERLVQARLIEILSNVLVTLTKPAIAAAATPADKELAIQAQTTELLTEPSIAITTASVATLVGISNIAATTTTAVVSATAAPVAGFSLRNLDFTNASNWFVRVFSASTAQDTPDAAGNVRFVEQRFKSVSGQVAAWGSGGEPRRTADLSFNGTAWAACPINFENTSSQYDAQNNNRFNYCGGRETGISNRASFDVSGRTMVSVYQQLRDAGYTNLTIANAATALGSATFGTGASLRYQTSTPLTSANSYDPGTSNILKQYSPAVTAGGVASSQSPGVGCNSAEFNVDPVLVTATLEAMMSGATGTPCVFTGGSFSYGGVTYTNPDATNEAWGPTSLSIGTVGSAPVGFGTAPGFYTSNSIIRVAFKGTGTNPVTYYSCKQRFNNGSSRNCSVIGTGSYTITTQGDARSMSFNNPPAAAAALTYQRVFIERGGKIFFGYKNNLSVTPSARLNSVAGNQLLTQLGLPTINPEAPLALTRASYQGIWDVSSVEFPLQKSILFISNTGTTSCQDIDTSVTPPLVTNQACVITFTNLATGAFTASTPGNTGTATGTLNFITGAANGTVIDGSFTETLIGARR